MVAPDAKLLNRADGLAGLGRELSERTVVVQTQHRGEALGRKTRSGLHGDVAVRVAGIADNENVNVAARDFIDGLALFGEDGTVGSEKFSAFHTFGTRTRTDEECRIGILKGHFRVDCQNRAGQCREGAVHQFHFQTLEFLQGVGRIALKKLQNHRLVLTEKVARSDTEDNGIADVTGCTCNGNTNGCFHFFVTPNRTENWRPGRSIDPIAGTAKHTPIILCLGVCSRVDIVGLLGRKEEAAKGKMGFF